MNFLQNITKQDITAATGHVIPTDGQLDLDDNTLAMLKKQPFIAREIRAGHLIEGKVEKPAAKKAKMPTPAGHTISGAK